MFDYFKGKLASLSTERATLEVGGIGYLFHVPISLLHHVKPGIDLQLYASWVVREQSQQLYGFLTSSERDFFELLLTLSGIGPKTALNLLGNLPGEKLQKVLTSGDIASLCEVPGIGKKTAERLLMELKGKNFCFTSSPYSEAALSALLHLGMSRTSAQSALEKASQKMPSADLPTLIATALQFLS